MLIGLLLFVIVMSTVAAAGWYTHSKIEHMFDDLNIPDKDIYY